MAADFRQVRVVIGPSWAVGRVAWHDRKTGYVFFAPAEEPPVATTIFEAAYLASSMTIRGLSKKEKELHEKDHGSGTGATGAFR